MTTTTDTPAFAPFEWLIELFAVMGFIGIVVLIIVRQLNHPRRPASSRDDGSGVAQRILSQREVVVRLCALRIQLRRPVQGS